MVYFPLVGFIIGLIAAIFCYINSILFNKTIAVTLALLIIVIITVANHEKEFFNSFNELEKSFFKFNNEIIAILLLFFVVIVKLMCVSSIPISELTMAFVLALTVSRWSVVLLVYRYDYNLSGVENFNNKEQIMDEVKQVEKITTEQFIVATLLTLVPIILFLLPVDFFDKGESICLSIVFFERDCCACGMTRAIQHLIHFDFSTGYEYNRLSIIVLPFLIISYYKETKRMFKLFCSI